MIPGACYAIKKTDYTEHLMMIYDMDGNILRNIPLSPEQYYFGDFRNLAGKLIDPTVIHKARPTLINIETNEKMGKIIQFLDKHNNTIMYQTYSGPVDLYGLIQYQKQRTDRIIGFGVDYQWILENNVPIINNIQSNCELI